jgi:hypothetical protein
MTPTRTIYVVWKHWYDDVEIVCAFAHEGDATEFAAREGRRSNYHYTVAQAELRGPSNG